MNKSLLWRGILILGVTVLMALTVYPPKEKIKLGLDLRGGVHMVLRVKTEDALRADRDKVIERLVSEAKEQGVAADLQVQPIDDTSFSVVVGGADREKVEQISAKSFPEWTISTESGGKVVFRLPEEEKKRLADMAVRQALQTIDRRINEFGVAEPLIQRQGIGGDRIGVQLPGVDDPERVKQLIKSTAFLEFRIVEYPQRGGGAATREEVLAAYNGVLPDNLEILESDIKDPVSKRTVGTSYYAVQKLAKVTGRDLKSARGGLGQFNDPIVEFNLTRDGGERFAELTASNINKGLAIVLDNKVVSAPNIESRIADSGIIRGQFTQEQVDDLSTVLRTGALPAGIVTLEERTVGPSLGQDSIRQGVRAGLVGAIGVVVWMLIVYNLSGLNAVIALVLNILVIFGGLAYFDATLTLPGIAGVVLTMGMAVDANVLVFERIREELAAGRTVRSAIDEGFGRAWASILDTHLTTLISALFLFQFGTGPIRGFAVTLGIGLTASLFTAVFVSRWLFDLEMTARKQADSLSIG